MASSALCAGVETIKEHAGRGPDRSALTFLVDGEAAERSVDPQELEATCQAAHPAVRPGCCAAFAVELGGEARLAVALEVDAAGQADHAEVLARVRRALVERHEVPVFLLLLLAPGGAPRPSDGQPRRRACREALCALELDVVAASRQREGDGRAAAAACGCPFRIPDAARRLTTVRTLLWLAAAEVLGRDPEEVDLDRPLDRLGLTLEALLRLDDELTSLGMSLPLALCLGRPTLAHVAVRIAQEIAPAAAASLPTAASLPAPLLAAGSSLPAAATEAPASAPPTAGDALAEERAVEVAGHGDVARPPVHAAHPLAPGAVRR